ncbi:MULTISPECIES: NAD(P)H-dependent oxidoreductase [Tenacibaculum]|uniref:NAD(P)H oxidoreductase n=1 Tax=Tenacibaculum mesophilum TaxID=104268 RepID=A0AAE9SHC3_9FLAO|nr:MULTISPECIES: NAD(P)H-dependent oxidoreductase [Tenacibaculum]GFD80366.1 NAD(P)H oxidoreductase [Tenacibaculum sp. KUL118]GFD92192.1 NAD(P)H oxidoreductase [Alteromonas sp. KUL154]GFE03597.1 NAD(P)H oxidoreductase [Alteromonas sp. KUL156]AZJ33771.1 NAD(P)H oxidoreductase [Tenacibaculum mesophilum]MCG7501737.1 NAD(P)H-dependent oxidoreductase [Tenacibaculum sp. Mcav3-52]
MKKVLILFAHPKFEQSRVNSTLVNRLKNKVHVTFHDLYENYPNFHINIQREQELLLQHDIIIWHHPLYWYSSPAILKQWKDLVLEFNWAYGPEGKVLHNKTIFNVITTGGSREVYCTEGYNTYTINEFLRPYEQTAKLCGMNYLSPFAVMGTHNLSDEDLLDYTNQYEQLIDLLQGDFNTTQLSNCSFLNDLEILTT